MEPPAPPPRFTDDEYQELVLYAERLVEEVGGIPHPNVRDGVYELLQALDAIHREALTRLVERLRTDAPAVAEALPDDPAIRALLTLYDLGPDVPEEPEPPHYSGFVALEDLDVLEIIRRPVWIPGGRLTDLAPGALAAKSFEGVDVLLGRVGDDVFALRNACAGSILTLQQGRLEGETLVCPWHGCRYSLRTGVAEANPDARIQTFPVHVGEDGRFSVGFNIDAP